MFTHFSKTQSRSSVRDNDLVPQRHSHDSISPDTTAAPLSSTNPHLKIVASLQDYTGATLAEKMESLIQNASVLVLGRSWCPFYKDAVEFLTEALCIDTYVLQLDHMDNRSTKQVLDYIHKRTGYKMSPMIFIRGVCLGGCQELLELYATGELERYTLRGLFQRVRAFSTEKLETAKLAPIYRGRAMYLPGWFPAHVNNYEVRLSAVTLAILSVVAAGLAFSFIDSARWIVFVMAIDQFSCMLAGPTISPVGAMAMMFLARKKPDLVPGGCKQVTAFIGCVFTCAACIAFFIGHANTTTDTDAPAGAPAISGCVLMSFLAALWGLEAIEGANTGKRILDVGFYLGVLPEKLYTMYLFTRKEAMDTWTYRFTTSENTAKPIQVHGSRSDPLALRYKKKAEDWSKDDFDPIRRMEITYFAMPASIAGLALVFKIGGSLNTSKLIPVSEDSLAIIRIQDGWFQAFSSVAAFIFIFMMFLYFTKSLLFLEKVKKEWYCPERSSSFSYVFISLVVFGFLLYDDGDLTNNADRDSSTQVLGRVLYWVGALSHVIFCVMKMAEWLCRRLDFDHIHANWSLLPVGLALSGFCTPIVGALSHHGAFDSGNTWLGRFYVAFSQILFTPIFVITFYKALAWHNSNFRERHGMWLWVAAQCMLGLSDYTICEYDYASRLENDSVLSLPGSAPLNPLICGDRPVRQVAGGVFLFMILCCASLPRGGFFFRDDFNMGYWTVCFALNLLAAAATFFYTTNGWYAGLIAEMITVVSSAFAHVVVCMHTLTAVIRKHGVCTSSDKWGPLSIIRLTHSAIRESRETLEFYLRSIDLDDESPESLDNLGLFAAHFNRFRLVHEEHTLHDQIVFEAIRELYPRRGHKCDDDHRELEASVLEFCAMINMVLDPDVAFDQRKDIVARLQQELPLFLNRYERHLLGEEYDLLPVAEKYLPKSLGVQLVMQMWKVTPPEKWEVMIDFALNNLPRQSQRTRYLKILVWACPERAQQIGAMVYRKVDATLWERLRCDVPAIVPRGVPHWKRYE